MKKTVGYNICTDTEDGANLELNHILILQHNFDQRRYLTTTFKWIFGCLNPPDTANTGTTGCL